MRRFHLGLATVALPVFAFTLFLTGCKDEKKDTVSKDGGQQRETPSPTKGDLKPVVAKNGQIKGKINWKGSADLEALTKKLLMDIASKPDDKDNCLKGGESEKTEQTYRIGANKLLGNVFVWIKPEPGTYFQIDPKQLEEAKNRKVVFHQPHCAFIPHCAVLFPSYLPDPKKPRDAIKTGQILEIKNDAQMSHNTKWEGPKNPGGNETLAVGKVVPIDNLVPASGPVTLKCNIHTWMDGYLWVFDHPYATVSLSDTMGDSKITKDSPNFGTYELTNLPVGKVRIVAWHESAGFLNKGEGQGKPIEIKEGEPLVKDFDLNAK